MERLIQKRPVQASIVVPLRGLAELTTHEEELLARMRPHPSQERPQVRHPLPWIPRHLVEQRAFDVHHFVVRKRQDEALAESVEQTKGKLPVVMASVNRILGEVLQGVVHPAHIPLEVDSSATITTPGCLRRTASVTSPRKAMASRFSRPPNRLGIQLPSGRL